MLAGSTLLILRSSVSESNPSSVPDPPQTFLGISLGIAELGRLDNEPRGSGYVTTIEVGEHLYQRLYLVQTYLALNGSRYHADPTSDQDFSALLLGTKWCPFDASVDSPTPSRWVPYRYLDMTAFSLKLSLGVEVRDRTSSGFGNDHSTTALASIATASLGWLPVRGAGFALGVEVEDSLAHFNEGFQNSLIGLMTVELFK